MLEDVNACFHVATCMCMCVCVCAFLWVYASMNALHTSTTQLITAGNPTSVGVQQTRTVIQANPKVCATAMCTVYIDPLVI